MTAERYIDDDGVEVCKVCFHSKQFIENGEGSIAGGRRDENYNRV